MAIRSRYTNIGKPKRVARQPMKQRIKPGSLLIVDMRKFGDSGIKKMIVRHVILGDKTLEYVCEEFPKSKNHMYGVRPDAIREYLGDVL